MSGTYYVDAADWLRSVGLVVVESDGWQTRARSSGGFADPPLGIQWHHTASSTSPENDIAWQTEGSDDAPIGNMTIMRDGSVWLVAAGAANTAGKGGPVALSRGTVPVDSGNSTTWAIEVANNGVGEPWPAVQVDAYFTASNELNRRFGNQPTDVFTHAIGDGDGYTDRKIDPATADAVEGPWRPRPCSSSGTWSLADIRAECLNRAHPIGDDDMTDEQAAQLADVQQQCQELRRLLGVLFGAVPPGNEGEQRALTSLYAEGETPADTRRMVGVMLGWSPPAPDSPEPAALERLWA